MCGVISISPDSCTRPFACLRLNWSVVSAQYQELVAVADPALNLISTEGPCNLLKQSLFRTLTSHLQGIHHVEEWTN